MHGSTVTFPDYSFYATDLLIRAYAAGPERIATAIAGLSEAELRARARGPERWSIHEIIMHIADSEMQGSFRIRKTWAEPPSEWPVHDQDQWSRMHRYNAQSAKDRRRALMLIRLAREHALPVFWNAAGADWDRNGVHPEFGVLTLRNLLELYADHAERHLEQILHVRELLGRPISMALLLPRRLF